MNQLAQQAHMRSGSSSAGTRCMRTASLMDRGKPSARGPSRFASSRACRTFGRANHDGFTELFIDNALSEQQNRSRSVAVADVKIDPSPYVPRN